MECGGEEAKALGAWDTVAPGAFLRGSAADVYSLCGNSEDMLQRSIGRCVIHRPVDQYRSTLLTFNRRHWFSSRFKGSGWVTRVWRHQSRGKDFMKRLISIHIWDGSTGWLKAINVIEFSSKLTRSLLLAHRSRPANPHGCTVTAWDNFAVPHGMRNSGIPLRSERRVHRQASEIDERLSSNPECRILPDVDCLEMRAGGACSHLAVRVKWKEAGSLRIRSCRST